jgi:hypothetical protein
MIPKPVLLTTLGLNRPTLMTGIDKKYLQIQSLVSETKPIFVFTKMGLVFVLWSRHERYT